MKLEDRDELGVCMWLGGGSMGLGRQWQSVTGHFVERVPFNAYAKNEGRVLETCFLTHSKNTACITVCDLHGHSMQARTHADTENKSFVKPSLSLLGVAYSDICSSSTPSTFYHADHDSWN